MNLNKTLRGVIVVATFFCGFLLFCTDKTEAATYYVSQEGSDSNKGSYSSPFRSFSKAQSLLTPGDQMKIFGGIYNEMLSISRGGTSNQPIKISGVENQTVTINTKGRASQGVYLGGDYVDIENIKITGSDGVGLDIKGRGNHISNVTVTGAYTHGINFRGTDTVLKDSTIYGNVLENYGDRGKWGSAVKISLGADNVTLINNTVYDNWGEGIAATRASNVRIEGNRVYDNFSANIYVDNSFDVVVDKNFVTCRNNSGFERNGEPAKGIMLGEESYSGWGSRLDNVQVTNNIVAFCYRGVSFYSAEVSNPGLRNSLIAFNTLVGSKSYALYINDFPETKNSQIVNNIITQPQGKVAYVPDLTGLSMHHNFWSNNPGILGQSDKIGDPRFIATPGYTKESFQVVSASSAVDAGVVLSDISIDLNGKPRSQGNAPDLGAIEKENISCKIFTDANNPACFVKITLPMKPSVVAEEETAIVKSDSELVIDNNDNPSPTVVTELSVESVGEEELEEADEVVSKTVPKPTPTTISPSKMSSFGASLLLNFLKQFFIKGH